MKDKTILFVDDEKNILRSFKRLFMDTQFNLILASNGVQALEILEEESVNLIITDMRMPYMNGHELLKTVKTRFPNVIRIILSGYAEKELIVKMIQENLAMAYLLKPWDNEEIVNIVKNLVKVQEILKNHELEDMMSFVNNGFAYEDEIYDKLLDQIEKDKNMDSICSTIQKDVGLSTMILHMVNSAFYGSNVSSIEKALEYLNIDDLKNLLMTERFNRIIIADKNVLDAKKFLINYSYLTNKIIHFIYREILNKNIEESHRLAGLLSNIGMLILLKIYEDDYARLINQYLEEGFFIVKVEKEKYGLDHQEVGGYLLNCWGIPYPIIEAAFYHHNPADSKIINREFLNILCIANYYAFRLSNVNTVMEYEENVFQSIGITKDICDKKILENFYIK